MMAVMNLIILDLLTCPSENFLKASPKRGVEHFSLAEANAAISSLCLSLLSTTLNNTLDDKKEELLPIN